MKTFGSIILIATLILFAVCSSGDFESKYEATKIKNLELRKIGVGDRRLSLLNAIILNPEAGVNAVIIQTSHNYTDGKVVRFQPATGKTKYIALPHSSGAWGGARRGDDVYIGGHIPGDFYHLKIFEDQIQHIVIPRPTKEKFEFVWSLDIGSDGMVYLGTYPECILLRFDPKTRAFENLGIMAAGEQYIRHVNGKFEGKIYCGIGSHAQLVEYNLTTGEVISFLPQKYQNRSFVYYSDRFKDMLYAVVTPEPVILFFDPESRQLLREVQLPGNATGIHLSCYQSFVAFQDDLYFSTRPDDNLYRYNYAQNKATSVASGVGIPFGLAQNRYLFCRNYFGTYTIFDLIENRTVLQRKTQFEGAGMDIFCLAEGIDNTVVGGSYINQGYFCYQPETNSLTSMGAAVRFGGQIRQIVAFRDKHYLAHYTHARLSEYDPHQPWNPGNKKDSNPRVIGAVGHEQDRFPAAFLGEDDKIYFGTQPEYGVLGGALVIFDPVEKNFEVFRNIVPDQSIFALTGNHSGVLFGGTSIVGGLGSHPVAKEAKIFAWDMAQKRKTLEISVIPGATSIWSLLYTPENKLIGAADSVLFVYDIKDKTVEATMTVSTGTIMNIIASQDGWCYGNTHQSLFRFSKDLKIFQEIDFRPDPPNFGRGLIETAPGRIFIGIGATLYELVRK